MSNKDFDTAIQSLIDKSVALGAATERSRIVTVLEEYMGWDNNNRDVYFRAAISIINENPELNAISEGVEE
jgi:hypothetical protein